MPNDAFFFGKNSFWKSRGASLESRDGQPGIQWTMPSFGGVQASVIELNDLEEETSQ